MKLFSYFFLFLTLTLTSPLFSTNYRSSFTPFYEKVMGDNNPTTPKKKKLLLIIGCPRSGTGYAAHFFDAAGVQIGHEFFKEHGTCSWLCTVDTTMRLPYGQPAYIYDFEHIFHQVREPLAVISSIEKTEGDITWNFVTHFVSEINGDDLPLVRAAKLYYYWNLIAEKKAEWTYRLEDLEELQSEIGIRLGIPFHAQEINIDKNYNKRTNHTKKTWAELAEVLPQDLFYNLQEMALRYGYSIEDEKLSDTIF